MLPSELDHGVAERQAVTAQQRRPKNAEEEFLRLTQGRLRMPPHPEWQTDDLFDWTADPFKDRNWQFQHHTLRWLDAPRYLAQQGDQAARNFWVNAVRSWSSSNLPPESATSPWAWKDMADGTRAIVLALGVGIVPDDETWFVPALQAHRDYLLDEKNIVKKNHAMHQLTGLLVVSAALRDDHAATVARDRLAKLFESVFDTEGTNDEGSLGYHQLNLTWWTTVWKRVSAEGLTVPEDAQVRLRRAAETLAQLAQPDGHLPQIGDTKRDVPLGAFGPPTEWVRSRGQRGSRPSAIAKVFRRGYISSRSGWDWPRGVDHSHMLVRFGPDYQSHSHQDRGSVHLYTQGRPWLVDSGFLNYQSSDPFRRFTLSRDAHNLAFVEGLQVDPRSHVELLRSHITAQAHDFLLWDKGYDGLKLTRRVTYFVDPDFWVVYDHADSQSAVHLGHRWLVDVGLRVRLHDRGYVLRDRRASAYMHWLGRTRPKLTLHRASPDSHEGWIATKWNHKEPGSMITANVTARSPRLVMLFAGTYSGPLSIVHSDVTSDGRVEVEAARGSKRWLVQISDPDIAVTQLHRDE
ncbi:heparinase II/III domain-containing protein [Ornithinimicrobium sufpigmenti]|uniref:heparinase II/III domain-containing protein n=1 Tax=Ornithinimicrobium sufpigmenti TaxID=2508882 RepID=UPI0015E1B078|nr:MULTISPECIES: heparinase II/III family protein [unclassified Ornithinimicrobium]